MQAIILHPDYFEDINRPKLAHNPAMLDLSIQKIKFRNLEI